MTARCRATSVASSLLLILIGAPRLGAQPTPLSPTILSFTHFADGGLDTLGRGWESQFSVVNTSGVATGCTLSTFGNDGSPVTVNTKLLGRGSVFPFTIPKAGTQEIATTGEGAGSLGTLIEGYATLNCDQSVTGGLSYTLTLPNGDSITSVGVTNAYPSDTFISEANATTGFALVNLSPTNALGISVTVNNLNGTIAGSSTSSLGPGQHKSAVLSGLVSAIGPTFQGSVTIHATSPNMLATAINVVNVGGAFVLSTIPSISFDALHTSYTGAFSVVSGPDLGSTGTISLTNIAPFDAGKFNVTVGITFKGSTTIQQCVEDLQSSVVSIPDPIGQAAFILCGGGLTAAERKQTDGSFSGVLNGLSGGDIATVSVH